MSLSEKIEVLMSELDSAYAEIARLSRLDDGRGEVAFYEHVMRDEDGIPLQSHVTRNRDPWFGKRGRDYSPEYSVTVEPLYREAPKTVTTEYGRTFIETGRGRYVLDDSKPLDDCGPLIELEPSAPVEIDVDLIALDCATEIMQLFDKIPLPGGRVQIKAAVQCRVIAALERRS